MRIRPSYIYLGILIFAFSLNGLVNRYIMPEGLYHYWKICLEIPLVVMVLTSLREPQRFHKQGIKLWRQPIIILCYLLFVILLTEFYQGNYGDEFITLLTYFAYAPMGYFLFIKRPNEREVTFLLRTLKLTGIVVTVIFYLQFYWHVQVTTPGEAMSWLEGTSIPRYGSTLDGALSLGAYLYAITMLYVTDLVLKPGTRLKTLGIIVVIALITGAQVLSTSRAAIALTVGSVFLLMLVTGRLNLRNITIMVVTLGIYGAIAFFFLAQIPDEIARLSLMFSGSDNGNLGRITAWTQGLSLFSVKPFLGYGLTYAGNVSDLLTVGTGFIPESFLLQTLINTGIIGFGLFTVWFYQALKLGLTRVKRYQLNRQMLFPFIVLCGFIVYFVVLQTFQEFAVNMLFWLCLGIISCNPIGLNSKS